MKIGIIREGKVPPDSRVPLNPEQCAYLKSEYGVEVVVQPSAVRIFNDEEYAEAGIELTETLADCDLLLGIKEVPIDQLIPGKRYCFFSHTHKEQVHNRKLLQAVLAKYVHLIDYEVMTDHLGRRIIAFGYFAGVVGAHNALWTYGQRSGAFALPRMKDTFDYETVKAIYQKTTFPPIKIALTGTGRVSTGAARVLDDMGIRQVSANDFLQQTYQEPVYAQLLARDYMRHKKGMAFDKLHYYQHPAEYESTFMPFARVADIMINGIFWDKHAPAFFTAEQMAEPDFSIKVIADVTCDIAPESSIPSTLYASTIAEPVFGYDPATRQVCTPYQPNCIDMMTIDNLPSELPRDASTAFGQMFIEQVLPHFLAPQSAMIERASIARHGKLGNHFTYLENFAHQKNEY